MHLSTSCSSQKATGKNHRSRNRRSFVSNEGVIIVSSPPEESTARLAMVQSDHGLKLPKSKGNGVSSSYSNLRQPKSVRKTPSESSFESAVSQLEPLPRKAKLVPNSLKIPSKSKQRELRKTNSAPATKTTNSHLVPQPQTRAVRSQDNLHRSKHSLKPGLRGALRSVTPGYIREIPRSLPLKRQLTKTPSYQIFSNSTSDSLYQSWKEYFKTPDPFDHYYSSQLFDSIKLEASESIKQFLDEIDFQSPAQSLTTVKENVHQIHEAQFRPDSRYLSLPLSQYQPPKTLAIDRVLNINVGGECFMVKKSLVLRYPNSLLASPDLEKYYSASIDCYFFNRSRFLFEYILQLYQCGHINLPPTFLSLPENKQALYRELDFFRLRSDKKKRLPTDDPSAEKQDDADDIMKKLMNGPGWTRFRMLKLKLYVFLTNPQSSTLSLVWMVFDMILVLLSIVTLILESEPRFEKYFNDKHEDFYRLHFATEILSQGFFTLDFLLRMFSWPRLLMFFKKGMNICDFISLLPYYIPQLISLVDEQNVKTLVVFRIIRMFRIARVFRVIRHSHGLLIIFQFMFNSGKELVMLAGLFSILTLVFSSMIYFVETHEGTFSSISASGWWAVVTLTGIGYGDVVPKSAPGQVIAVIAIMTGVVFLALPMTIIITKFTKHMERHYGK